MKILLVALAFVLAACAPSAPPPRGAVSQETKQQPKYEIKLYQQEQQFDVYEVYYNNSYQGFCILTKANNNMECMD